MSRRLGILLSHPVQYQVPWFRHLVGRLDLEVFYAHRQDEAGQARAGFGVAFEWDIPLLDGYPYRWLKNVAAHPGVGHFRGCDTPELFDLIDPARFDAFLVFGWNRKSYLQAAAACKRRGVPLLMRGDSQLRTRRSALFSAAKYAPYRLLLPRIDGHLYVGRRNREYLRHYGVPEDRLFFCPHFVDNDYFSTKAEAARADRAPARLRGDLGIPAGAFVCLFAGKFIPKKRPLDFVEACLKAATKSGGNDLHAVLVGDGPLRAALEERASAHRDRVHFAGFRNQSELPAYYAASDALVLPSDGEETWGLVVNEAMACGLPCVVSDAVGCGPDLIDDGRTGFRFPCGDTDALADRLLATRELLREDRASVRNLVAEKIAAYSIAAATRGLERALDAVTSRRRAPERRR